MFQIKKEKLQLQGQIVKVKRKNNHTDFMGFKIVIFHINILKNYGQMSPLMLKMMMNQSQNKMNLVGKIMHLHFKHKIPIKIIILVKRMNQCQLNKKMVLFRLWRRSKSISIKFKLDSQELPHMIKNLTITCLVNLK